MSVQDAAPFIEADETFVDIDRRSFEALCPALLSFDDIGLDCAPARSDFLSYNVFNGALCSAVPILRTFAANDDLVLVQLLSKAIPPVIGSTAFVCPTGEKLQETESQIALAAFQTYRKIKSRGL
jgi:hypothetical protein